MHFGSSDHTVIDIEPSSYLAVVYDAKPARRAKLAPQPLRAPLYEIARKQLALQTSIGRGYFGEVFKALYTTTADQEGSLVAVKELATAAAINRNTLRQLQEASMMASLQHPNVVRLIGVVTVGEPVLIVLELCENGSLSSLLASRHDAAPHQLLVFSRDCAAGMRYLVEQGVLHRDLAARNVLVDAHLHCKIGDFGLSTSLERGRVFVYDRKAHHLPIRWTAPDAIELQTFSEFTESWSYGVLLYEIWSKGVLPYAELGEEQVRIRVRSGHRLEMPASSPVAIQELAARCWLEDDKARPRFIEIEAALANVAV